MSTLEVVINAKMYEIGCEPEEVDYILTVVRELNHRIASFKERNPNFIKDENTEKLFLIQMLLLCSELMEAKNKKSHVKNIPIKSSPFKEAEVAKINGFVANFKKSLNKLEYLIKH